MNKLFKKGYFVYLLFFLVQVVRPQNLFSQSKYTVLLPEIDKAIPVEKDNDLGIAADEKGNEITKSFFKFDFRNLPVNAKIGLLNLKLYNRPNINMSDFSVQTITVLKGTNEWTGSETALTDPKLSWAVINHHTEGPIGRAEIKKSTTSVTVKLKLPGSFKTVSDFLPDGILSLAARSPEKGQRTKFFSSITSDTVSDFSKKPKLLVTYEVDTYPFREDWAQPYTNSQHNSLLNWKTNTFVSEAQIHKLPNIENEYFQEIGTTGALAIYKNLPVIFTQTTSGTGAVFYVRQLDAKGNILWSQAVDDIAKCWPLIDESGRLYYISRAGKLTLLDLNNRGNVLFAKSLSDITNKQVTALNNNATIGYDGTLYLPSDSGIVALSAYPQLKMRWKYEQKVKEINGPVSLSPDESKAFFINVDTPNKRSRLIVLNNSDGSLISTSGYVLDGYQNDNNFYIPSPVVQNDSRVFVLNGFDNSSKLFVFDDKIGIDKPQIINSGNTINTGISQPVIDAQSNVFFVFNNKLAKYSDTSQNNVYVLNKSVSLDNASILVADASSNIYATDPYHTPKKIVGFKTDSDDLNSFSVNIDPAIGNTKKNITLAPDGTVYTVMTTGLIAITAPKVGVNDLTIKQADLSTNTVYRASNSITVEGISVLPTINTILNSAGSISFKPGFTVTQGAQITCKTGY